MSEEGSFRKMEQGSENRLYGPPCIVVCGFPAEEQELFIRFASSLKDDQPRAVFCGENDHEILLKEIVAFDDRHGYRAGEITSLPRAVIVSGIKENDFMVLMKGYRSTGLPRPLWATLTPVSESWKLGDLLDELAREDVKMREFRTKKQDDSLNR